MTFYERNFRRNTFGSPIYSDFNSPIYSDFKVETEIPFKPDLERPIYCRECLPNHREF